MIILVNNLFQLKHLIISHKNLIIRKFRYSGSRSMWSRLMLSATFSDQISKVDYNIKMIVIVWSMLSVNPCPKVIKLSGFHCVSKEWYVWVLLAKIHFLFFSCLSSSNSFDVFNISTPLLFKFSPGRKPTFYWNRTKILESALQSCFKKQDCKATFWVIIYRGIKI